MKKGKYPIIANGELYVESIMKKQGFSDREMPHEYGEAKTQVYNDLIEIEKKIYDKSEIFLDEKILCIRLEPKFEAKSYVPDSLIISDDMKIIGGRKYTFENEDGDTEEAKLYFVKTKDEGIKKLKKALELGTKDSVDKWKKQMQSIKNIDLLNANEKIQGIPDSWKKGKIEIVLHPLANNTNKMIKTFIQISGLDEKQMQIRTYEEGFTFISAICDRNTLSMMGKFNPLRAIHPLGDIDLDPFRMTMPEAPGPKPAKKKMRSNIKVGVFDGGIDESLPLLSGYVKAIDKVQTQATKRSLQHGISVCGAILHGHLGGKTPTDELINPAVSIDSFRVLPTETDVTNKRDIESIYGMYDTIDTIEQVVAERKDIKLFNLSFGPNEPILDDSISRFTYALDRLTYLVEEGEINPLFCVAVGNDGDKGGLLDRIQSPSDMVNGLAVGAYSYNTLNEKTRTRYSSIGPGREGAKTKPDILEFGGNQDKPFVVVGTNANMVGVSAGTSLATPLATGKIGRIMAQSKSIVPHMGRTLLIHNAKCDGGMRDDVCGYGFSEESVDNILKCDENRVTILYAGELPAASTAKLPIFSPAINQATGNVKIIWTVSTIVSPDITDTDAYTNNCIEDTFYPNSTIFNFTKKGNKTIKLNIANKEDSNKIEILLAQGYKMSDLPVSGSPKKGKNESELRNRDFKWDTVIKKEKSTRAKSLLNPFLTLHAIGRNGYEHKTIRYFVSITVDAPGYKGNLYDNVLQTYSSLLPIEIQSTNRVMVPIE